MRTHLDVAGTSGATYRFRLVTAESLPAHSGNYLLVRDTAAKPEVVAAGVAGSLGSVEALRRRLAARDDELRIFVRLNVAREARESEHLDILGQLSPDVSVIDLD